MKISVFYPKEYKDHRLHTKKAKMALLFIQMLEDDDYFNKKIVEIRKFTKQINDFSDEDFMDNLAPVTEGLYSRIYDICEEYSIDLRFWLIPFSMLITKGVLVFPSFDKEIKVFNGDEIYGEATGDKIWSYTSETAFIVIDKYIGKTKLLEQIEKSYANVSKILYKPKLLEVPIIKLRNIEVYKAIYDLRIRKGFGFDKISKKINDDFEQAYGSNEIRTMFMRYCIALKDLHRNKLLQ